MYIEIYIIFVKINSTRLVFVLEMGRQEDRLQVCSWIGEDLTTVFFNISPMVLVQAFLLEVLSRKLGSLLKCLIFLLLLFVCTFFFFSSEQHDPLESTHLKSPNPWLLGGILNTYQVPSSFQSKMLLQSKMGYSCVIDFETELSKSLGCSAHIFQLQQPGKLMIQNKHIRDCYSEMQAVCNFML